MKGIEASMVGDCSGAKSYDRGVVVKRGNVVKTSRRSRDLEDDIPNCVARIDGDDFAA